MSQYPPGVPQPGATQQPAAWPGAAHSGAAHAGAHAGAAQPGAGQRSVGQYAAAQQFAAEPETIVVRLRRHGRRLVLPIIVLLVLAAAGGYFVGSLPEEWMNLLAGGGGALVALLLGVFPIFSWLSTRSIVTTKRIIVRRGLLVHHRWEVPLSRVREVRMRRGPVQRLFGSGDVLLLTTGDSPFVMRDVPSPGLVVDALHELIEQGYLAELGSTARL